MTSTAGPRERTYRQGLKVPHLRALLAIAENGTFSGAALDLDTSQPTLSNAITELERSLGTRLLDRGRFGAVPTEVGRRILPHVRQLELVLEAIAQEAAVANGELRGRLRIDAFRSAAARVLPAALARLRREHPALELSLDETEHRAGDVAGPLLDCRFDVAITTSLHAGEALFWELFRDPFVVVVPPSYEGPEEVSIESVLDGPVIIGNSVCWLPIRQRLAERQEGFRPSFDVSEDSTMLAMVAEGLGVALMPAMAIDALPPGVRQLRLHEPLDRRVGVALSPTALKVPSVRAFLAVLRDLYPDGEIPRLS